MVIVSISSQLLTNDIISITSSDDVAYAIYVGSMSSAKSTILLAN